MLYFVFQLNKNNFTDRDQDALYTAKSKAMNAKEIYKKMSNLEVIFDLMLKKCEYLSIPIELYTPIKIAEDNEEEENEEEEDDEDNDDSKISNDSLFKKETINIHSSIL